MLRRVYNIAQVENRYECTRRRASSCTLKPAQLRFLHLRRNAQRSAFAFALSSTSARQLDSAPPAAIAASHTLFLKSPPLIRTVSTLSVASRCFVSPCTSHLPCRRLDVPLLCRTAAHPRFVRLRMQMQISISLSSVQSIRRLPGKYSPINLLFHSLTLLYTVATISLPQISAPCD